MKRTLLLMMTGASFVIAGVGSGIYLRLARAAEDQSVLSPELVEFATDPIEGSRVTVPLQVHNKSPHDIVIENAAGSCGCMEILTHGRQPFTSPITVPAGSQIPVEVTISTAGRIGRHDFKVGLRARSGSRVWKLQSLIKLRIRSGWRTRPRQLVFSNVVPGQKVEADFDVFDSLDDPGIAIGKVSTTSADLKADVTRGPDLLGDGPDPFELQQMQLKHRYRVHVEYVVPESGRLLAEESVVLRSRKSMRRLAIPVLCHIRAPAYRLFPQSLMLPANLEDLASFRRTLRCELGTDAAGELQVLHAPPFLEVALARQQPRELTILVSGKQGTFAGPLSGESIVVGVRGGKSVAFRIPLFKAGALSGRPARAPAPSHLNSRRRAKE